MRACIERTKGGTQSSFENQTLSTLQTEDIIKVDKVACNRRIFAFLLAALAFSGMVCLR